jgi:hypothetical protein
MTTARILLDGGRVVILESLQAARECVNSLSPGPFVVLLPAFSRTDIKEAEAVASVLLAPGCAEICCIGGLAEDLHDRLDCLIEDRGLLSIATTWDRDLDEGVEYFVTAAGGGTPVLCALVSRHPMVVDRLRTLARA